MSPSSTRSITSPIATDKCGVFHRVCLICKKTRRKKQGQEQSLVQAETKDIENNIKRYSMWLNDEDMLREISDIDFVAKEVVYHSACRKEYQSKAGDTPIGKSTRESRKGTDNTENYIESGGYSPLKGRLTNTGSHNFWSVLCF